MEARWGGEVVSVDRGLWRSGHELCWVDVKPVVVVVVVVIVARRRSVEPSLVKCDETV